jgi:hypothetical protein
MVELLVTVAVMAVLATLAYSIPRAAIRNANLNSATFEFALRLSQVRSQALAEQVDYLVVGVNASRSEDCSWTDTNACTRYFILSDPRPGWSLSDFVPTRVGAGLNASYVDDFFMPRGVEFYRGVASTPPAPFQAISFFDTSLTGNNCGGQDCFAIRFEATGDVSGELAAGGTSSTSPGYALALTTTAIRDTAAADRRGILVSFPTGIVRAFPTF